MPYRIVKDLTRRITIFDYLGYEYYKLVFETASGRSVIHHFRIKPGEDIKESAKKSFAKIVDNAKLDIDKY